MTKTEIATIKNVIARLKKPNCGCGFASKLDEAFAKGVNEGGYEVAARLYPDTWIITALELLVDENRDPKLAERLSRPN